MDDEEFDFRYSGEIVCNDILLGRPPQLPQSDQPDLSVVFRIYKPERVSHGAQKEF